MKKLHETNSGYYLDILEDEEDRLVYKLLDRLDEENKYWFLRYVAVRDRMQEIKTT